MKHVCEKCWMEFDTVGECSLHEKECSGMMEFDESVFERKSCPEWAQYAVINKYGVVVFSSKPMRFLNGDWVMNYWDNRVFIDYRGKKVFRKDYSELMLTREKNLSMKYDMKPGDWVYSYEDGAYFKVLNCDGLTSDGVHLQNIRYAKAEKIPYEKEQLKKIVGKVVQDGTGKKVAVILEYNEDHGVKIGEEWYTAEDLLWGMSYLDGMPVGVLRHYDEEKGEWVK